MTYSAVSYVVVIFQSVPNHAYNTSSLLENREFNWNSMGPMSKVLKKQVYFKLKVYNSNDARIWNFYELYYYCINLGGKKEINS